MKCVSIVTCFFILLSLVVSSRDCPQCFHSLRLSDDQMETQPTNTRRIFRLKNNTNNNNSPQLQQPLQAPPPLSSQSSSSSLGHNNRPYFILPLNRDIRKGVQSIQPFVDNDDQSSLSSYEEVTTQTTHNVITTIDDQSDHYLQHVTTTPSPQSHRIRAVSVRNGLRRRRWRKRMQRPHITTTTTTTTTTAQPLDYYEYEDEYDYDDYHLTTTTTTTAPRRRAGGRRRRPTTQPTTTTTTTLSPGYKQRSDGRIIDYLADPNFPYELKGTDLTNYPFYISIPENNFKCMGRHDGYYANIELKCQVYHHCASGHQRYDFLCPNYTLFDQTTFTCRFINTVDCDSSENYYIRNNELYVQSTTPSTTTTTTSTSTTTTK